MIVKLTKVRDQIGSKIPVRHFHLGNLHSILRVKEVKKEMIVTLKVYQEENINLLIPFKKGNYVVTDPKNPILIKVKG